VTAASMPRNTSTEGFAPTLASLRVAHAVMGTALARLGQAEVGEEKRGLVTEARQHLTAALALVDGVGMALRKAMG
jgi:hypothetical protein